MISRLELPTKLRVEAGLLIGLYIYIKDIIVGNYLGYLIEAFRYASTKYSKQRILGECLLQGVWTLRSASPDLPIHYIVVVVGICRIKFSAAGDTQPHLKGNCTRMRSRLPSSLKKREIDRPSLAWNLGYRIVSTP